MKFSMTLLTFFISLSVYPKLDNLFDKYTELNDPFNLRDPFKAPLVKSSAIKKIQKNSKYELNNVEKLNAEYDLDKFIVSGVLIGKERRVVVKIKEAGEDRLFTLKEGEAFGKGGPKIKAILSGGVILAEKLINIYGEPEYIETIVPLSE